MKRHLINALAAFGAYKLITFGLTKIESYLD